MTDTKRRVSVGLGFTEVLFLVFLVLKLTGTIGWSWWYVTAPLWGPLALVAAIAALAFGVAALIRWPVLWLAAGLISFVLCLRWLS